MKLPTYRQIRLELARRSFWEFCKLLAPDFYKDSRPHLKTLCDTLQALFERKLLRDDGKPFDKLIIEIPPRHGKSRTLTNFSAWVLGKDNRQKIITASFNDDLAQDFSRHTRDIISEQKNTPSQIAYSDIFDARIKKGDASFQKWALEGQFFNYKGTGIGGSVTGRGGSIIICDDPVKDAETAYNENALEKIWLWYSGTLISRAEEGAIQILCMTPWAQKDLGGILRERQAGKWHVLSLPACTNGVMLCPEIMSLESYLEKRSIGDESIFAANYDMQRLDIKGRLYSEFKTYTDLPSQTEASIGYCDTADEGADYLCAIMGKRQGMNIYVTDVVYTKEAQEKTEPMVANALKDNEIRDFVIESNNGGRAFARNVQRLVDELGYLCNVRWFHQSKNKQSRILTNAPTVYKIIHFPEGWQDRWPEFYKALTNYQREGKNKNDDAPDALTGLVEKFGKREQVMSTSSVSLDGCF